MRIFDRDGTEATMCGNGIRCAARYFRDHGIELHDRDAACGHGSATFGLVVPVPEANISSIAPGAKISFTLPSFPGETFSGIVQRISNALDQKTRTMPVELDVSNPNRRLAPGMVPEVMWPVSRPNPSMFVPASAIATTTERSFVIRIRDGVTEWVDVKRGASMSENGKDLVEVFGAVSPGDQIVVGGTDELRAGTRVTAKPAAASK